MRPILPTFLIEFDGKLYKVVRTFKDVENFPVDEAKEYYSCDTVLKKDGIYYMCQVIEEPEYEES